MAEISEPRIREIVRDELSVMQVPQRLASIEATLEHKADKADVESLRGEVASFREELKGEIASLRTELKGDMASLRAELKGDMASLRAEIQGDIKGMKGDIKGMQGGIKALEVEQRLTREFIKTNSRILIGIGIAILFLLIRDVFK